MHSGLGLILNRNKSLFKGLLDNFSGASAAYSLRRLAKGEGEVVRVRRASDNAEQDFSAAAVASGAMLDWVGTTGTDNGFVTKWYDQSGNGNDAVQTTAANQPKIVDAGTLVAGGIDFDGVDDYFGTTSQVISGTVGRSVFCVVDMDTVSINEAIFAATDVANAAAGEIWNFTAETAIRVNGAKVWTSNPMLSPSIGSIHLPSSGTVDDHDFYLNGSLKVEDSVSNPTQVINTEVTTTSRIGRNHTTSYCDGKISELIIYNSDQSSNRTAIEANIADEYGITLS